MKQIITLISIICISTFLNAQTINLQDLPINTNHSKVIKHNGQWWHWDYKFDDLPLVSTDQGDTWQTITPNITLAEESETILFNGVWYSIAGKGGTQNRTNRVDYSTDGINWTTYNASFPARRKHNVFLHKNRMYVLGGEANSQSHRDVWYTEDGLSWTQATNAIFTGGEPTFYESRAASVNDNIIIFGGQVSGFGTLGANRDTVYVSTNDGVTFTAYPFPYSASLHDNSKYFVYNNKLWLFQSIEKYHDNNDKEDGSFQLIEGRYFSTTDGINWEIESEIDSKLGLNFFFVDTANNQVFRFDNQGNNIAPNTSKSIFKETSLQVPTINSFIANENATTINIPFPITNANGTLKYCVTSSNNNILSANNFAFNNGDIIITPDNTKTGNTLISIEVSDDTNTEYVDFWYYNVPGEKVALSPFGNRKYNIGETVNNRRVFIGFFNDYGTNSFSFTSSNSSFINENEMQVSILPIVNFRFLNLGNSFTTTTNGEAQVSVTATDGTYSSTSTFWIKVGDDLAPIANGTLGDYEYNGSNFDYQLPTNAFTEPENQELVYSSDDLPCGLSINSQKGAITGDVNFQGNFTINIIATDRYNNSSVHILNVVNSVLSIEDNLKDEDIITIYPNPSNNYLKIQSKQIVENIKIYNITGKILVDINNSNEISHQLNSGIYIVKIITKKRETVTRKIIVN